MMLMRLFGKETCTFCGKEVGIMHRSKLATGEFICNVCMRKTNPFARMNFTSRDAAQRMIDTLASEEAQMENAIDRLEPKSVRDQARRWEVFDLGGSRVSYRASPELGCFQLATESTKRYEHNAVLFFDMLSPYLEQAAGSAFPGAERVEIKNQAASCATVEEIRDPEGNVTAYAVIIPYNDDCIREIRLNVNTDDASIRESCHALADRINTDRIKWSQKEG